MIFQKQNSAEHSGSEDDDDDSGMDLQDAEKFFQDKNFKFSRRWGEFRAQHFTQILSQLSINNKYLY